MATSLRGTGALSYEMDFRDIGPPDHNHNHHHHPGPSPKTASPNSLELLLPRPSNTTVPHALDATTRFIEEASIKILLCREPGDRHNPGYAHLHPTHVSEFANHGISELQNLNLHGRDDFIRARALMKTSNPDINLELSNVTSTVDEAHDSATVFVSGRLSHF